MQRIVLLSRWLTLLRFVMVIAMKWPRQPTSTVTRSTEIQHVKGPAVKNHNDLLAPVLEFLNRDRESIKCMSYTGIEISKEVNEHNNSDHTAGHLKMLLKSLQECVNM